jgi:hypothetical protein
MANGGKISVRQIAADAFGNALGESIAANSQSGVDWRKAPDQSDAETARLARYQAAAQAADTSDRSGYELAAQFRQATKPYDVLLAANGNAAYRATPQAAVEGLTRATTNLLTSTQYGLTEDLTLTMRNQAAALRREGLDEFRSQLRSIADDSALQAQLVQIGADYFGTGGTQKGHALENVRTVVGILAAGDPKDVAVAANLAAEMSSVRQNPFSMALLAGTLGGSREMADRAVDHLTVSTALEYRGATAWNFANARDIMAQIVGSVPLAVGVGLRTASAVRSLVSNLRSQGSALVGDTVADVAYGFKSDKYIATDAFDGRRVYKNLADFDGGVPATVDPSVNKSIREKINAGWSNKDLMKAGYAPIGADGKQINLHHVLGKESGPMVELTTSTHQRLSNQLHGLIESGRSFRNDPVLNKQYNDFRSAWWKQRAGDF